MSTTHHQVVGKWSAWERATSPVETFFGAKPCVFVGSCGSWGRHSMVPFGRWCCQNVRDSNESSNYTSESHTTEGSWESARFWKMRLATLMYLLSLVRWFRFKWLIGPWTQWFINSLAHWTVPWINDALILRFVDVFGPIDSLTHVWNRRWNIVDSLAQ